MLASGDGVTLSVVGAGVAVSGAVGSGGIVASGSVLVGLATVALGVTALLTVAVGGVVVGLVPHAVSAATPKTSPANKAPVRQIFSFNSASCLFVLHIAKNCGRLLVIGWFLLSDE